MENLLISHCQLPSQQTEPAQTIVLSVMLCHLKRDRRKKLFSVQTIKSFRENALQTRI